MAPNIVTPHHRTSLYLGILNGFRHRLAIHVDKCPKTIKKKHCTIASQTTHSLTQSSIEHSMAHKTYGAIDWKFSFCGALSYISNVLVRVRLLHNAAMRLLCSARCMGGHKQIILATELMDSGRGVINLSPASRLSFYLTRYTLYTYKAVLGVENTITPKHQLHLIYPLSCNLLEKISDERRNFLYSNPLHSTLLGLVKVHAVTSLSISRGHRSSALHSGPSTYAAWTRWEASAYLGG